MHFVLQDIVIKFSAPCGTQEANDWVKRIRDVIWNAQRRAEEIKVRSKTTIYLLTLPLPLLHRPTKV